jgi:predicted TIM-barrel enzyme
MEYEKKKISALTGETQMVFTVGELRDGVREETGKIIAGPVGVTFSGQLAVMSYEELQELAALIGEAWKAHMSLKKKIVVANQMDLPL